MRYPPVSRPPIVLLSQGDATYLIVKNDGTLADYGLNAVCTHLGCVVPWNKRAGPRILPFPYRSRAGSRHTSASRFDAALKRSRGFVQLLSLPARLRPALAPHNP